MAIRNLEGRPEYDVQWPWEQGALSPGLTAVLRVRDEAHHLSWVLPPLLAAVDAVVVVDNQSRDGTAGMARAVAEQHDASDKLTTISYPFDVSRCGREHLATPARSVHSLTHFYNWSFSHVRTTYAMKWDGDMVLTPEGVAAYATLSWRLQRGEAVVGMPRHPLYVESERVGYLDLALRNGETWVAPMGSDYQFNKAFDWELWNAPTRAERVQLPEGLVIELKHLDCDEFDHWSAPEDFTHNVRTQRKRREWEVFNALRNGHADVLDSVVRIEAPAGVHVVDHVRASWLPHAPRPLVGTAG